MKQIYRLKPTMNNTFLNALLINDEPPKLVDLMNSKVNYNREDKIEVDQLPNFFRTYLFDFAYPLNDEYKEEFEILFLTNFIERRIGYETYTSFKMHLKVKLFEIMPKYNKMLEGFSKLDFLGSQEVHTRNEDETGSSNSNSTNDNRYSQLPQNEIEDVQNGTYLTDYTYNQGNSKTNANRNTKEDITISKIDSIDEYKKYRENVNSIYSEMFKELNCLFLLIP